jgi:DNA repair ATPase RecN
MVKNLIPFILLLLICAACNNADNKHSGHKTEGTKTQVDSLMDDVMEGHDVGMAKYSKLNAMQKEVKRVIDSLSKLHAKSKEAAAPYKAKLDSVANDLNNAIAAMDKWMEEFNMDSAVNNMEERIKYLGNEKMKVGKVKESILKSLEKADSLLKAKL